MIYKKLLCWVFLLGTLLPLKSEYIPEYYEFDYQNGAQLEQQIREFDDEYDGTSDLRNAVIDPIDLAGLFALKPLEKSLWNSTLAPSGRDVLYLFPQKIMNRDSLAVSLFVNVTLRLPIAVVDLFGDSLDEKIVTNQHGDQESVGFVSLLHAFLGGATPDLGADNPETLPRDIVTMLPFLKNVTLQEYKTGLFLQGGTTWGPWSFQVQTSALVAIRNFWLSFSDQETVTQIMANHFQGTEFDYSGLYRICAGIGDTRLKLGLNTVDKTNFKLDVGAEFVIPTASFSQRSDPKTDAVDLVSPDPESPQKFQSKATVILEGIRDHLLEPQIGNNGHFGIGVYMESKIDIFHELAQLWMRVSYDHLFSAQEDRLFIFKKTVTAEDLKNLGTDDLNKLADADNKYIKHYLLPSFFRCTIAPGGVFNAVISVSTTIGRWKTGMGYDFYAKQPEQLQRLNKTKVSTQDLEINRGLANKNIYQHKIFSETLYTLSSKKNYMAIGWGSDFTVSSKNIGKDWTLYVKFVASF